jgi:gliding motility-associated-like protein
MKKLIQILMVTYSLMLLCTLDLNAQVDQNFWFVVPETTRNHAKTPGILRITAFEDAASVRISQPANAGNFQPIILNVPANSQRTVEFHDYGQNIKGFEDGEWATGLNIEPPKRVDNTLIYEQMLWSIENGTLDAVRWDGAILLNHDWAGLVPTGSNDPVVASPDQIPILNKGLLIESTNGANISVYYEVANPRNPERFNLKGRNALGREFLIPSQNRFFNQDDMPKAREKTDIVATEDNTTITINFDRDVHNFVGKPATGSSFTITLNRGQTFSLRSNSQQRGEHLGGVFIQADKNIAITISDDSIREFTSGNRHHYDLVGDQLIPITITGTRYIAMHPSYGTIHQDHYGNTDNSSVSNLVFIWPVGDPTVIRINGEAVKEGGGDKLFSKGQFHVENISENGIYIDTNQPVIVYQISSYKYELGSAVLPALECTGSKQVSFARVYEGNFYVQILTKNKNILDNNGQNNFEVFSQNGTDITDVLFGTSPESSAGWTPVANTTFTGDEQWYSFVKYISDEISTGDVITVKFKESEDDGAIYDDELFHLSVLDANGASMSYGYFSSYNSVAISGPSAMCIGNDVELRTNGILANWFHAPNDVEPFETNKSVIFVTEPGQYWVEIPNSSCQSSDPINIDYIIPDFDLGADTTVCPGETVDLGIDELAYPAVYSWTVNDVVVPDHNTFTYSFTTSPNSVYNVILNVETNVEGIVCVHSDTIVVNSGPEPLISLGATESVCEGSELRTDFYDYLTYEWVFGGAVISNDTYITPSIAGDYTLTVSTADGCTLVQDIAVTINPLPEVTLNDVMACIGNPGVLGVNPAAYPAGTQYLWYDNSTGSSITLTEPEEDIWLRVTDPSGCETEATASFGWYNETVFPSDTILMCYSNLLEVEIEDSFTGYSWTYDADPTSGGGAVPLNGTSQNAVDHVLTIQAEINADTWSGRYFVDALDSHGCPVDSYFDLIITPIPNLQLVQPEIAIGDPRMCEGDTITITYTDIYNRQFTNFTWSYRTDPLAAYSQIKDGDQAWIAAFDQGQYYLYASMENGCDAEGDVEVTTVDAPTFEILDQVACPDAEILLGINPGTYISNIAGETNPDAYEWLQAPEGMEITDQYPIIGTDPTYTVDGTNRGSYRLTAFNSMGCFASEFATAASLDVTPVNLPDVEICDNVSYTLSLPADLAAEGGSYQWHQVTPVAMPFPFANSPWDLGVPDEGIYTYRLDYTNPSGCFSSGTMTLTVLPAPEFTLPSGNICEGETISITAQDSYASYEWNGVAGDNTYEVNASGNITLVVTDENGCSSSVSTNLQTAALPLVEIEDADVCPDEIVTLSVNFDPEVYNIMWTLPSGRTVRNTNSIETVEGTYSVMVADELGCAGRDEATVTWKEFPWVYFQPTSNLIDICPFQLPVEIEATGDLATWNEIHWHDGLFPDERRRIASLSDTVNVIRVMNNDGCWSRASQAVLLALPTQYEVGRDVEGCEPTDGVPFAEELNAGVFTLYEDSSDDPIEVPILSYRWYEAINNVEIGSEQTMTATERGQYVVEIFDGCWMHADTFNIDLFPNPTIAGIDSAIYRQVVVFAEDGTEPYAYALNDQEPQSERTFKNLDNGEYTVYVIDNNGCEASVNFLFESSYDITVPNFFTPNGDGFNDTWVIDGLEGLPESIIYIYDRFGKLLKKYGSNDPPWNGEYLNQPVPSDDYWYVIHLLPVDKYIRGNVTLKR